VRALRTVEGYLLAIRLFVERIDKDPESLTEEDVRSYLLHLRDDKQQAPSIINIATYALRFFFNFTLHRDFEVFSLLRVRRTRSLPVVLSQGEVRKFLSATRRILPGVERRKWGRTSLCVWVAARNTRKIIRVAIVRELNVMLSAPQKG
jgi:site-specific recombinase XerD